MFEIFDLNPLNLNNILTFGRLFSFFTLIISFNSSILSTWKSILCLTPSSINLSFLGPVPIILSPENPFESAIISSPSDATSIFILDFNAFLIADSLFVDFCANCILPVNPFSS